MLDGFLTCPHGRRREGSVRAVTVVMDRPARLTFHEAMEWGDILTTIDLQLQSHPALLSKEVTSVPVSGYRSYQASG